MQLITFECHEHWASQVASIWAERLRDAPNLRMCLPAGNTPRPVYEHISHEVCRGQLTFNDATVFLLDEFGGIASDDPGSCDNQLRNSLINQVDIPDEQYFRFSMNEDMQSMCLKYEHAIGQSFDLVVVGIGKNGHIGMNEPGSSRDSGTRRVELDASTRQASASYFRHQVLPAWGVTVGLRRILESREVWLLATGDAKAGIVARAIRGPADGCIPAAWLQHHPNCKVIVDAAAARDVATLEIALLR